MILNKFNSYDKDTRYLSLHNQNVVTLKIEMLFCCINVWRMFFKSLLLFLNNFYTVGISYIISCCIIAFGYITPFFKS